MIDYKIENNLCLEEFKSVLISSNLGERRPINEPERLKKMLQYGNLIITARLNGKLIGVSRSITDYAFCTYLSDLAVDKEYQKQGIGKELIRQTKLRTQHAKLILLAAPSAMAYYPKVGMTHYEYCYCLDDIEKIN